MCLNIVDDNGSDTHVLVKKVIKIKKVFIVCVNYLVTIILIKTIKI